MCILFSTKSSFNKHHLRKLNVHKVVIKVLLVCSSHSGYFSFFIILFSCQFWQHVVSQTSAQWEMHEIALIVLGTVMRKMCEADMCHVQVKKIKFIHTLLIIDAKLFNKIIWHRYTFIFCTNRDWMVSV